MRHVVAVVLMVAAAQTVGGGTIDAFPSQCHARVNSTRTASGICYAGNTGDGHRVLAYTWRWVSGVGMVPYWAVGGWRYPDNASWVTVPSGHRITSAREQCREYPGAAAGWCPS